MILQTLHQGLQTFVDVRRQLRVVPEKVDRVLVISQEYSYIINKKFYGACLSEPSFLFS